MSLRYGLAHSGTVFRQCREARDVTVGEMLRWSGLTRPTLSNIELRTPDGQGHVTMPRPNSVTRYIEALAEHASPPLTRPQAELLELLYDADREARRREEDIAHLDFGLLDSPTCPPQGRSR